MSDPSDSYKCGDCLHYRRCWYENHAYEDDSACFDFESPLGDESWWPPIPLSIGQKCKNWLKKLIRKRG